MPDASRFVFFNTAFLQYAISPRALQRQILTPGTGCRSPLNGNIHVLIPGRILLFAPPDPAVPPAAGWCDAGGRRSFAAEFLADLLGHLRVALVIQCDSAPYDHGPFLRRGIAIESLSRGPAPAPNPAQGGGAGDEGGGGGQGITLQALDRFLSLLGAATGRPVALHCAGQLDFALGLVAAHMIRARLFPTPIQVISWLQITRPAPAAELNCAALQGLLERARPRASRSFSFSREFALATPEEDAALRPGGGGASQLALEGSGGSHGRPRGLCAQRWVSPRWHRAAPAAN